MCCCPLRSSSARSPANAFATRLPPRDGWIPLAGSASDGDPLDYVPRFRQMAEEAGRDPHSLPVTVAGPPEDADLLKCYRDLGIARVNFPLPPAQRDEVMPALDRLADLMRQLDG
jgi:hypothetical protein